MCQTCSHRKISQLEFYPMLRKEISHDNDAFSTSVDLRDSYDVENLQNFSNELA